MSRNSSSKRYESDESDDVDLLTLGNRITKHFDGTPKESLTTDLPQDNDDEPDWVREFSQSLPNEQQRRKALALQFDEDDDESVIDLVPNESEPLRTQSSEKADLAKAPQKRQKTGSAPRSRIPLVIAPKLDDSLVLLQSGDQSLDLSGDVGAVGRVKVQRGLLYMDIKGTVYRADTSASNTACVVSVGEDEAKVTAILDKAVTLVSEKKLFAGTETVIQGELEENERNQANKADLRSEEEAKPGKERPSGKPEKGEGRGFTRPRTSSKNSRKKS